MPPQARRNIAYTGTGEVSVMSIPLPMTFFWYVKIGYRPVFLFHPAQAVRTYGDRRNDTRVTRLEPHSG